MAVVQVDAKDWCCAKLLEVTWVSETEYRKNASRYQRLFSGSSEMS
jgi:hypothetical protein